MASTGPDLIAASKFTPLYIPPTAIGYGYYITNESYYLGIAVAVLVSTVWMHGMYQSVYGPEGPNENPLDKTTRLQRLQAAVWKEPPADQYPKDLRAVAKREDVVNLSRLPVLIVSIVLLLLYLPSVVFGIYVILKNRGEIDFIGVLLLFGLIAGILRMVFWRFWPTIHQFEEEFEDKPETDPQLSESVNNFRSFIKTSSDISLKRCRYNPVAGALQAKYQTDKSLEKNPEDYKAELKACINGFAAFLESTNYPCHELKLEIVDDKNVECSFTAKAESANRCMEERITLQEVFSKAEIEGESLSLNQTEDEVLEFQETIPNEGQQ
ncbi:hypothetical protein [Natrinema salinisoli]|uniref:hypothetical protein n=1 Tax=Natrinema salinisoli TaxID=2878535 RepID=UPI001CEFEE8F|nr:hypothetical protein [Natrinema salinisoli]